MSAIYLPDKDTFVLLIPGSADEALRATGAPEYSPLPDSEARAFAVIRDPLERFQEFHRRYWIETQMDLPASLRELGFQKDWPVALVASHTTALASAQEHVPGLVKLGWYSPQSAFWPEGVRPEFLLYEQLALDWETKIGSEPAPVVRQKRYKFAPAAIIGDVRAQLERAYATDLAVYAQVSRAASQERERLRGLLSATGVR